MTNHCHQLCVCVRAVIIQTKFNSKFIHSFSIELCSLVTVVDFERLVVSNHPHVHRGINVYIMELAKSLANWVATESWKYKYINDDGPAHIARCTCFIIRMFLHFTFCHNFFLSTNLNRRIRIWMSYDKKKHLQLITSKYEKCSSSEYVWMRRLATFLSNLHSYRVNELCHLKRATVFFSWTISLTLFTTTILRKVRSYLLIFCCHSECTKSLILPHMSLTTTTTTILMMTTTTTTTTTKAFADKTHFEVHVICKMWSVVNFILYSQNYTGTKKIGAVGVGCKKTRAVPNTHVYRHVWNICASSVSV